MRDQYPQVPWRQIAGMRDRLSHDYINVNLWRVFRTVQEDLPVLQAAVSAILDDLEPPENSG